MYGSLTQLVASASSSFLPGTLYVLATPIGNLSDISLRALSAFSAADIICAEDTRVTAQLLAAYGIKAKKIISLREHNEQSMSGRVIGWLKDKKIVLQVSDAGTTGISDPGARLADEVLSAGLSVCPLPGCCAAVAALSASGVTSAEFLFAGFLPAKTSERKKRLANWLQSEYAVVCYEAPHRIVDCLHDIITELGEDRRLIFARELTKTFETILRMRAIELLNKVETDSNQQRGEIVLIIDAVSKNSKTNELDENTEKIISILAEELPTKQAAALAAKISGKSKKMLYEFALSLKNNGDKAG